jgi:hypothetical protein
MKCFLKLCVLALIAQAVLLALFNWTAIGDGVVYLFYAIPTIFLLLPRVPPGEKREVSTLILVIGPMIIYTILFGIIGCLIKKGLNKIG